MQSQKKLTEYLNVKIREISKKIGDIVFTEMKKQIQEDLPPSNTQQSGFESIEQLMKSEAYRNANHPEHAATAARVRDWFSKSTPE